MNDKKELIDYNYAKSNILIGSKYKSTLLENKLMAISLNKINLSEASSDRDGTIIVKCTAQELKKMLNVTGGSFYNNLERTANSMTGRTIGFNDPDSQTFEYIAIVDRTYYKDGIFTIEFNKHINKYLTGLKKNFTQLNLITMLSFESVYSFRLFELLKSKAYSKVLEQNRFIITFSMSELKLELGVVNAEIDSVRKILRSSSNPDYDAAVNASPEKMYNTWKNFKQKILDTAINEINKKTQMNVEYTALKQGKGGKVYAVEFDVTLLPNVIEKIEDEISDDDKNNFASDVLEKYYELGYRIKIKDALILAETLKYSVGKLDNLINVLSSNNTNIENIVGWSIAAIKEDYKVNKSNSVFNDIEEQDYDFAELERLVMPKKKGEENGVI